MASLNPFSGPNSGENLPWADQTQLSVTTDTPPISIFKIPKTRKEEKLEACVPQRTGLELYQKMEQNKLIAVKRVLNPIKIRYYENQVVEKIKEIIPIICSSYDLNINADNDTLAWLFAIDGLFLLDQLGVYSNHHIAIEAKDLIMLENQIPLIVLKEIQKVLSVDNAHLQQDHMETMFQIFCKSHSPFLLSKKKVDFSRVNHLFDYMYHSIMNNETSVSREFDTGIPGSGSLEKDPWIELFEAIIKVGEKVPGAEPLLNIIISFIKNLSEDIEEEKPKPRVEKIKVPSVSELHDIAKVKFLLSPRDEGIRSINFVLDKDWVCYLPQMILNYDSEVVLRNLIVYEKLMAKNSFITGFGLELTEYVDFMCGIINTDKDVRLLRKEKIIESDLEDEEIDKLFNGISRSLEKQSVKSELTKCEAELNKVYESMPIIWVKRMAKEQVRASAKAITFLVSISSTLILISEVYSKAYGSNPPHMTLVHFLSEHHESFFSLIK